MKNSKACRNYFYKGVGMKTIFSFLIINNFDNDVIILFLFFATLGFSQIKLMSILFK